MRRGLWGISALSARRGRAWSWRRQVPVAATPFFPCSFVSSVFSSPAGLAHFLIGGIKSSFQTASGEVKAVLLVHIQRTWPSAVMSVYLRPNARSLCPCPRPFSAQCPQAAAHRPVSGRFVGLLWAVCRFSPCRGYSGMAAAFSVALAAFRSKTARTAGAVKIVAQFQGGNGLCPVRREVGQPTTALLDGHALPQQQRGKTRQSRWRWQGLFRMVCRSFSLFVSNLVCRGVIPPAIMGRSAVQRGLSFFLRPIPPGPVTRFLLPFRRSIW